MFCNKCGRQVEGNSMYCPNCGNVMGNPNPNNAVQNINQNNNNVVKYASFGSRAGAYLLDSLMLGLLASVMFVVFTILRMFISNETVSSTVLLLQVAVPWMIILFGTIFYRGLKDPEGKTLGRKVTKIIVVKENGSKLEVSASVLRQFLSCIINGTGFLFLVNVILLFSDSKRQTLTDKIMKTVVVYK